MKSIIKYLGLVVLAVVIMAPTSVWAGTLYFSLDDDGQGLYTLNTSTGAATNLGATGVTSDTVGLAPSGDASILYGSTWTNINEINSDGSGYSLLGSASAEGLAYDPYSGVMYGTINGSFFTINTSTGVESTYLAAPGADIEGLAYGNGGIYGLAGFSGPRGYLYFYDVGQNQWSFLGDTGIDFNLCGLAFDNELGILYAKGSQDSYLYGIDPGSAETWVIGDTGIAGGGGLAFIGETSPVPIPGAVWLLGSGLVGLAGLRRKRMK